MTQAMQLRARMRYQLQQATTKVNFRVAHASKLLGMMRSAPSLRSIAQ